VAATPKQLVERLESTTVGQKLNICSVSPLFPKERERFPAMP
jgi:hypothetical protein